MGKLVCIAMALSLSVIGCSSDEDETDNTQDLMDIRAMADSHLMAENTQNVDLLMEGNTADIVVIPPGAPMQVGADNVRAFFEAFFSQIHMNGEYQEIDMDSEGDIGWVRGTWVGTFTPTGGEAFPVTFYFLAAVVRDTDGKWKSHRIVFTDNVQPFLE